MKDKKKEKTVQQYRKDIFTLKGRIQTRQQHLEDLRQQYSNLNVLSDQTYTYSMKMKILQYSFAQIRQKLLSYAKDQAYDYYALNFSMKALLKACEVVGITPEMIFRGLDVQLKGQINVFDFSAFLKQSFKMDSDLSNPLLQILDQQKTGFISLKRYMFLLQSFLARKQQNGELNSINESMQRVSMLIVQRNIDIRSLWNKSQLNIATFINGIMKQLPKLDILDCVGCYCKCDPLKLGSLQKIKAIGEFQQKCIDIKNFKSTSSKSLMKSKV